MTTATLNKQMVEAKWTTVKMQEEFARVMAQNTMTTMGVVCKHGEELTKELQTAMLHNKVEHFKALNVKTPMDMIKAMSEFEVNMFGSKVEVWGDEKAAHMQYNSCGMWNAMKKVGMAPKQEEQMGNAKTECMTNVAKEFGFKYEMKTEGDVCVVSITH
jgi:hypothetical protein